MTEILAAIENSRTCRDVLATARTLAGLLDADVEAVYAHENDGSVAAAVARDAGLPLRVLIGEPAPAILRALDDDDVLFGVIGSGRFRTPRHPIGVMTRQIVAQTRKPIVVVPPSPATPRRRRPAVVVPIDRLPATGKGVQSMLDRLARCGAEIVALHVFDAGNAPWPWDRYYYDFPRWCEDFWVHSCPSATSRLEIGRGPAVPEVLRVAEENGAVLIALPWSQDMSGPGATFVTELLRTTQTPVLLVPELTSLLQPDARLLTSAA